MRCERRPQPPDYAPERSRTSTDLAVHKALNLVAGSHLRSYLALSSHLRSAQFAHFRSIWGLEWGHEIRCLSTRRDDVGQPLNAPDIWGVRRRRGFKPNTWANPAENGAETVPKTGVNAVSGYCRATNGHPVAWPRPWGCRAGPGSARRRAALAAWWVRGQPPKSGRFAAYPSVLWGRRNSHTTR
jgi:hypothetical protein